uniref:Cytochrome c biogenesis protein Ccs1 n=1 Tax=Chondria sp. (in: red algae) TaxID=1982705 RepID=A0A1Z1MR32_9FLOR|nr:cytochrome c biogenesis protein ccs1 [Chondria sp. (in: red algae)]
MASLKFKNYLWNVLKYLANLNLSIFILLLITIFGVLGSIVEQDQSITYYQTNYPLSSNDFFVLNWKLISYIGLDHVFQTWWFLFTLLIFILTLLSCTFLTQLPSLRNARRWKFFYGKNHKVQKFSFEENYVTQDNSLIAMIYVLLDANFFIFCQKKSLYAYKGLYGRISPIFVHFSIVTILIGSMTSFLCGFTSQEMIPSGEFFHIRHIVRSGIFSQIPSNILGRVDYFNVDYNLDGSVQQFFSKISIFSSSGLNFTSGLLSVNHPLRYYNLTFYQTDWEVNGIKIRINNNTTLERIFIKTVINGRNCWICSLPLITNKQVFFVVFQLNEPIFIFNSSGLIIGKILNQEVFYLNQITCVIDSIMTSTGLQIKIDLGITIVYIGFFVLMLSTFVSYVSYSQIWFYHNLSCFHFLALTNRSIFFFEEDIFSINFLYTSFLSNKNVNIKYIKKTIL